MACRTDFVTVPRGARTPAFRTDYVPMPRGARTPAFRTDYVPMPRGARTPACRVETFSTLGLNDRPGIETIVDAARAIVDAARASAFATARVRFLRDTPLGAHHAL